MRLLPPLVHLFKIKNNGNAAEFGLKTVGKKISLFLSVLLNDTEETKQSWRLEVTSRILSG